MECAFHTGLRPKGMVADGCTLGIATQEHKDAIGYNASNDERDSERLLQINVASIKINT